MDSLLALVETNVHDTLRCDAYMKLAKVTLENNLQEGIQYFNLAKEIIDEHLGKDNNPLEYYLQNQPYVHNGLGKIFRKLENYPESLSNYLAALDLFTAMEDSLGISTALFNIGGAYRYQDEFDKALQYYNQSLEIQIHGTDTNGLIKCYNALGIIYRKKGDSDQAILFYKHSLDLGLASEDTSSIISSYINLGVASMNISTRDAEQYFSMALRLAIPFGKEVLVAKIRFNLAGVYLKTNRPQKAIEYCKMALEIYERHQMLSKLKSLHLRLSTAYKAIGDNGKALEHLFEHMSYSDLLANEYDTKELVRIEMNHIFETERIADSIAFAKQKEISDLEIGEKNAKLEKYTAQKIALFVGLFLFLILAIVAFRSYRRKRNDNILITEEKERSERLLLNILPRETAQELMEHGSAKARSYEQVSVLFTDFKGFTNIAEVLSPEDLVAEIDHCYKEFDRIIERYNIEKIKTIGDAYMCAGGLPGENKTNPIDAVNAALEIRDFMKKYKEERDAEGKPGFEIRIGIHTGPVVSGIVGIKKFAYDIWGDTVNIASRMESSGEVGMVNISNFTYELVNDQFECEYRGKIAAKNKGDIDMYFVKGSLN
ncbi:MAG: adenylate/guanylate cyclase domain-containing protein [Crocinitomicaceae bacterium]|nr:adenylate/guanylate cyclase domain-containing protein [Crocinitomicaceae bacterium]